MREFKVGDSVIIDMTGFHSDTIDFINISMEDAEGIHSALRPFLKKRMLGSFAIIGTGTNAQALAKRQRLIEEGSYVMDIDCADFFWENFKLTDSYRLTQNYRDDLGI